MKRLLMLTILSAMLLLVPATAQAHNGVDHEAGETHSEEITTEHADENGNAYTQAQYDAISAEQEQNFLEKNPVLVLSTAFAAGGAVFGGLVWLAVNHTHTKKKKK